MDPQLKSLLEGILNKDPKARATIEAIKVLMRS